MLLLLFEIRNSILLVVDKTGSVYMYFVYLGTPSNIASSFTVTRSAVPETNIITGRDIYTANLQQITPISRATVQEFSLFIRVS